ncbi:MAG: transglycosylase SLT domain-containing protein [Bacteroidia bacterium]|nr:transglycosylase SLT domain-containing protein [Bacteroidia bacterium]
MLAGCHRSPNIPNVSSVDYDLDSITARGVLRVVTNYNSVDFMMHKGQQIGYQYELAKTYANERGLTLEIDACNDPKEARTRLADGKADIWAASLLVDTISEWSKDLLYTSAYAQSCIVLVSNERQESLPDSIWVQEGTFEEEVALSVADTLGWVVVSEPNYSVEQIVQLVGEREIRCTLAPETIARANAWYYPTLDCSIKLTDKRDMSWVTRSSSPMLADDLSNWIKSFRKTSKFRHIYRKYMVDERSEQVSSMNISADTYSDKYEEIIKRHLPKDDKRINLALIQSIIFQESRYNPNAQSWVGAVGLMQLMPETGIRFGAKELRDPEQNISVGISYLIWIDKRLTRYVPNSIDRLPFSLAAYNVGLGHVMDAIRLARKFDRDTTIWENSVEQALLMKANPTVISDKENVKHGYCRGTETVSYVRHIIQRAKNYKAYIRKRGK